MFPLPSPHGARAPGSAWALLQRHKSLWCLCFPPGQPPGLLSFRNLAIPFNDSILKKDRTCSHPYTNKSMAMALEDSSSRNDLSFKAAEINPKGLQSVTCFHHLTFKWPPLWCFHCHRKLGNSTHECICLHMKDLHIEVKNLG